VTAIEIEITTKAANSTGWNTARCASRFQPRHWQEIVETTPPSPVSPPTRPLTMPMPMFGRCADFHRLECRPRQAVDRVEHQQHADAEPQIDRVDVVQQDHADRDADRRTKHKRPDGVPVQRLT
jgi:hypothetical protein